MSRYKIENKKRVTNWLLLKFPGLPWFAVVSNNSCYWCKDKQNVLSDQRKYLFFLVRQTFRLLYRWFNYLAEILLIFDRNKLCPLFVNFAIRHNPFLPLAWPPKRGREQTVERDFGKSASCHFSVYRPYFLRYGFQQDNFSDFSFSMFFLFLEAV